ncbi:MAG TPA: sigma-70 family RNA polymerase sigma factor [Candidatus Sulfotelmatobacter sp.]
MSTPANGRALAIPLVWTGEQRRTTEAQAAGLRSPTDEELMTGVQAKDHNTLEALFNRYSRLVSGIALRILRDYSEAEEVVQETFFYIYKKAEQFDASKGGAKAWIVQIAYSRSLDRKAHLSRRGFYVGTEIESVDDTLIGKSDVEREIGAKLDFVRLRKAFEDLTQMQRRTIELFYFEGLELKEISDILHEPFGNIRHHFYRGLERLRKSPSVKRLRGSD